MLAKGSIESLHQVHVDRELKLVAGDGFLEHLDFEGLRSRAFEGSSTRIDDDTTKASRPTEKLLVPTLEPASAYAVTGSIDAGVTRIAKVGLVHLVQIADEVRAEGRIGVVAKRNGHDVESRKLR